MTKQALLNGTRVDVASCSNAAEVGQVVLHPTEGISMDGKWVLGKDPPAGSMMQYAKRTGTIAPCEEWPMGAVTFQWLEFEAVEVLFSGERRMAWKRLT